MRTFNIHEIESLKKLLYYSFIHDAKIVEMKYNMKSKTFDLSAFNEIFNSKIDICFAGVESLLLTNIHFEKTDETILSLSVEEDVKNTPMAKCKNDDCMYLLFQMFSGAEIHILSKQISINTVSN